MKIPNIQFSLARAVGAKTISLNALDMSIFIRVIVTAEVQYQLPTLFSKHLYFRRLAFCTRAHPLISTRVGSLMH